MYIGSLEYDESIKKAEKIIIFGGGSMLIRLFKQLEHLDLMEKIVAICDNDIAMQGKEVQGILVLEPRYACQKYKDGDYIVYNQYFMEICEQLRENHISKIHLVRQGSL